MARMGMYIAGNGQTMEALIPTADQIQFKDLKDPSEPILDDRECCGLYLAQGAGEFDTPGLVLCPALRLYLFCFIHR